MLGLLNLITSSWHLKASQVSTNLYKEDENIELVSICRAAAQTFAC